MQPGGEFEPETRRFSRQLCPDKSCETRHRDGAGEDLVEIPSTLGVFRRILVRSGRVYLQTS